MDRPVTEKQKKLIRRIVNHYQYVYGIEDPHVKTVREASEWISETIDMIKEQEERNAIEADAIGFSPWDVD